MSGASGDPGGSGRDGAVRHQADRSAGRSVGRRPAQDVFRDDRQGIATDVKDIVQAALDDYKAGIAINTVSVEDAEGEPDAGNGGRFGTAVRSDDMNKPYMRELIRLAGQEANRLQSA